MNSHTVPRFLLEQFAYYDLGTGSMRLWQYAKGRPPWRLASPRSATRIERHFADPEDADREKRIENRLNEEFETPVHRFLPDLLRYRTYVLSPFQQRQLSRYVTLLFNRSSNRRMGTPEQVRVLVESMRRLAAETEKLSKVAERWTMKAIRLGYSLNGPITGDVVKKRLEASIEELLTEAHEQTTYVNAIEQWMTTSDEALDNGRWEIVHSTEEQPFVIGDAPVVTWQRLENGRVVYGQGFSSPDVEVALPIGSTACLHILPEVPRSVWRVPTVQEVNEAQAAFASQYCYASRNDSLLDSILQPKFGQVRIGFNAFSVRPRNYADTMFELLMNDGLHFQAPGREG